AKASGQTFYVENIPVRGFQSSVDYRPNFGLGTIEKVDTLLVEWTNNKTTLLTDVPVNQTVTISRAEAKDNLPVIADNSIDAIFKKIENPSKLTYRHRENRFVDFDRDRLIYHMISTEGPRIAKGDVNGDGLQDVFIGGAAGQAGQLLVQRADGNFVSTNESVFRAAAGSEDVDALFFDADNDNDLDLYVAHGGNEFLGFNEQAMIDQLYINDGQGNFSRSPQFLPTFNGQSSACVTATDYDNDGDQDLFVGIRLKPGYYGLPTNGYILNNDGKGKFRNITKKIAPQLERLGMITGATWMDTDGDGDQDLVVIGEWMPITIFENDNNRFKKSTKKTGLANTSGWWNCLKTGDFDNDGDLDLVVGNHGLNSRFSASIERPISLYLNDFDRNRTPEPIVTQYNGEEAYPMILRHDLVMQLPHLKKKYLKYHNYKEQQIEDIFSKEELKGTVKREVTTLETSLVLNNGDGTFTQKALPKLAQLSPTYGLLVKDFDKDGQLDILMGGNLHGVKPEVGRYDANYGLWLKGNGDGTFVPKTSKESGFLVKGQIRDLTSLEIGDKEWVVVAKNNEKAEIFEVN
ncbi:MAG: FG-GAP-like repeat-containing protein, partial [Bacteroidota bacterium]